MRCIADLTNDWNVRAAVKTVEFTKGCKGIAVVRVVESSQNDATGNSRFGLAGQLVDDLFTERMTDRPSSFLRLELGCGYAGKQLVHGNDTAINNN